MENGLGLRGTICSKNGSAMVEGAIVMPVVILAVMLMIRVFVFYMQIIDAGVTAHRNVMREADTYSGVLMKTYRDDIPIRMFRGGLLGFDVGKDIKVKAYLINEDLIVRAGEVIRE